MAIALVGNPRAVLLDEPSTGVDKVSQKSIHKIIMQQKLERSILLSTHDLDEVSRLSDKLIVMANGTIKDRGTASQLQKKYDQGIRLILFVHDIDKSLAFVKKSISNFTLEQHLNKRVVLLLEKSCTVSKVWSIMLSTSSRSKHHHHGIEDWQIQSSNLASVVNGEVGLDLKI